MSDFLEMDRYVRLESDFSIDVNVYLDTNFYRKTYCILQGYSLVIFQ